MKDAVLAASAAILVLFGTSLLFRGGNDRFKRESGTLDENQLHEMLDDIDEFVGSDDGSENWEEFAESLDWINNPPEFLTEDVLAFQATKKLTKKQLKALSAEELLRRKKTVNLNSVRNCMKTEICYNEAIKMPQKYAKQAASLLESADLVQGPIHADENKVEILIDSEGNELLEPTYSFPNEAQEHMGFGLMSTTAKNVEVLTSERMGFDLQDGNNRAFASGNVMVAFIFPGGIPLNSELGQAKVAYANYFRFFRSFTQLFIDPFVKTSRGFSTWVARENKALDWSISRPAKMTRRFPYERFSKMMSLPLPSAYQPFMMRTVKKLVGDLNQYASTKSSSKDCYLLWFHQSLPIDVAQFMDPSNSDMIQELNSICSVIHIWVGFKTPLEKQVIGALQGLMQPEQQIKTNTDPNLRGWFVTDTHADINMATDGEIELPFMRSLYSHMAVERNRLSCLMAVPSYQYPVAAEDILPKESEPTDTLEFFEASTTGLPDEDVAATTMPPVDIDQLIATEGTPEEIKLDEVGIVDVAAAGTPDMACCGIGINGIAYDASTASCCDDGKVSKFDEEGRDKCLF